MRYKLIIHKVVRYGKGYSEKDVWLKKSVMLDFVPFLGLKIALPSRNFEAELLKVVYDGDKGIFEAIANEDSAVSSLSQTDEEKKERFSEIVERCKEEGWEEMESDG